MLLFHHGNNNTLGKTASQGAEVSVAVFFFFLLRVLFSSACPSCVLVLVLVTAPA